MKQLSIADRLAMTEARNVKMETRIIQQEAMMAALVGRVAKLENVLKTALRSPRVEVEPLPEQIEINQLLLSAARMSEIAARVAASYGLSMAEIRGPFRVARIVHPRQEAMRIMYETGYSLPRIGKFFRRDHTTVLHGVRAARARNKPMNNPVDNAKDTGPVLQLVANHG